MSQTLDVKTLQPCPALPNATYISPTPPMLTMRRALVFVQSDQLRAQKNNLLHAKVTKELILVSLARAHYRRACSMAGGADVRWRMDGHADGRDRPHKLVRVVPRQRENVGEPRAGMQSGEGSGQVPRRRGGECRILYSTETGAFRLALRSFFLSLVHRTQGNTSRILMRLTLLG